MLRGVDEQWDIQNEIAKIFLILAPSRPHLLSFSSYPHNLFSLPLILIIWSTWILLVLILSFLSTWTFSSSCSLQLVLVLSFLSSHRILHPLNLLCIISSASYHPLASLTFILSYFYVCTLNTHTGYDYCKIQEKGAAGERTEQYHQINIKKPFVMKISHTEIADCILRFDAEIPGTINPHADVCHTRLSPNNTSIVLRR